MSNPIRDSTSGARVVATETQTPTPGNARSSRKPMRFPSPAVFARFWRRARERPRPPEHATSGPDRTCYDLALMSTTTIRELWKPR